MSEPDASPSSNAAIERSLMLLEALAKHGEQIPLRAIAQQLGLPPSTAHRLTALLVRRGLVAPAGRGHYGPGLALADLTRHADPHIILARAARPLLRKLAAETGATAHLGIWDNDMVTYLVKEQGKGAALFTAEGGQLEAYCSAIGKILLAHLEPAQRQAYLSAGPFVPLTPHTVTDPDRIAAMLEDVARDDFAADDQEIAENLFCVAVPVRRADGRVIAAISVSRMGDGICAQPHDALRACAAAIRERIG